MFSENVPTSYINFVFKYKAIKKRLHLPSYTDQSVVFLDRLIILEEHWKYFIIGTS